MLPRKYERNLRRSLPGFTQLEAEAGKETCSGDMLLEALAACAGVTLNAVATALEIPMRSAIVKADGDVDFQGTLGVSKDAPIGFKNIRLNFVLDTDASPEQIASLIKLTERYCVIFQTLNTNPELTVTASSIKTN